MAPASLEAMPQAKAEYSRMHPAKYSNFGTGVLTDFEPMPCNGWLSPQPSSRHIKKNFFMSFVFLLPVSVFLFSIKTRTR